MRNIIVDFKSENNYFKIHDPGNTLIIRPYVEELEKSRAEDLNSLMRSVNDIRGNLEILKFDVNNLTETQNTDDLKKNMFKMENKISSLNNAIKQELLELLKNEVILFKDIQFVEKRIEDWGKPLDYRIFKPVNQSKYKIRQTKDETPIVEFQKFLSRMGGHYGGWEEQDHLLFLKERAKYKNKEKFASALHCLLPDLSTVEIDEHEKWYQKYESLRDAQKEAIQKWRLEKEIQEKKDKEKEKKKNTDGKPETKKAARHRIDIAERIKEWKNQQLIKKLEEEERQKKEKEKLKQEEKKKLGLQKIKRLAVSQYKAEKINKTRQVHPEEQKTIQSPEEKARNKILLKAFRLQDMKFIEKKKIIRLQIETKSSEKLERLKLAKPALEYLLQRDPQRVFQPTLIWSQHCLESQKREKTDSVFDLNSIPRLAIPEWRRALK